MPRMLALQRWWQHAIILVLVSVAVLYSLSPFCLKTESTLRILATQPSATPPDGFYVYQQLNEKGVALKSITPGDHSLLIKFDSEAEGEKAEKILHSMFPHEFTVSPLKVYKVFSVSMMSHSLFTLKKRANNE
ncbi:MAG: Modulator protein MzrA [Candidatus Erwinia impunctatus]|nr:Modulator protein MzrA [Culicoides impunctatus]